MTIHDVHICIARSCARVCKLMLLTLVVLMAFSCRPKPQSAFDDKTIREYASMANLREETPQGAYIAGKPVLINIGESISHHYETAFTKDDTIEIESQAVSSLNQKINNRAENPGEVGTVVLLKWSKEILNTNIAGVEFCRVLCEVTIVDYAKHSIVGKKQFTGSSPEGTHRWGSSPEKEIVEYVNALPRRNAAASPSERSASAENSSCAHRYEGRAAKDPVPFRSPGYDEKAYPTALDKTLTLIYMQLTQTECNARSGQEAL